METYGERLAVVRLGAMGDILHALPAAISLKKSYPKSELIWITRARWMPLLEGNPFIDRLERFDRAEWREALPRLRSVRPSLAFDFQGLIQSALVGRITRPKIYWGLGQSAVRERAATLFYSRTFTGPGPHRIERNLQLIKAAGAKVISDEVWLPDGVPEGELPKELFVLASPFAGWAGKQWPLTSYLELGRMLRPSGLSLVLNVSPQQAAAIPDAPGIIKHVSSIAGLIDATRQAVAVVGVDSGPLHLAAALRKPGVGIYGPTDPTTHGPYGGSMIVLRNAGAETTYHRHKEIQSSMKQISPQAVAEALDGMVRR